MVLGINQKRDTDNQQQWQKSELIPTHNWIYLIHPDSGYQLHYTPILLIETHIAQQQMVVSIN